MRLKKFSWLALMTILALVISSCGGGGGGQPAGQPTAAPGAEATAAPEPTAEGAAPEPTAAVEFAQEAQPNQKTIVWMVRSGQEENPWERDVVLPAYQKAKPDVFVKVVNINQDDIAVKREAMIAAKEPLHVWSTNWGGDGFASDRYRGLITDLTPLIERDKLDLSDFLPDVLAIYQSEGKQWGIPFLTTGSYIYYNKKIFDDAGIAYPPTDWDDASWTWDAYVDLAKKLTKNYDDPNTAIYGANTAFLNLEGPPMLWGQFVWPEDAYKTGFADKVTVTDEKSIMAFQKFHDLVYVDKVAPDPSASQALDQLGGAFQTGRLAMVMSGGWGHWAFKSLINDPNGFCWGVAPMPMGSPDAKIRTVIYTDPWVITAGMDQENTDMAWDFVKFLTSKEQQAAYTNATGTPPVRSSLLADYYKQYEKCMPADQMKQVFEGAFTHGRESSNHLIVKWDELNQIWGNLLDPFWTDPEGKAADVLPQVEQQTNDALQRIKQESGR
ncbi:MAG TPA: extracellular solute-binding protein [Roseiflexaceae bacterium]|nr:extracellular solute-binding protein [Roseiflexaceae bacterium]